jgi:hypothetical protein
MRLAREEQTALQVERSDKLRRHGGIRAVRDEVALRIDQQRTSILPDPEETFDLDRRPLRTAPPPRASAATPRALFLVLGFLLISLFVHYLPLPGEIQAVRLSQRGFCHRYTRAVELIEQTGRHMHVE